MMVSLLDVLVVFLSFTFLFSAIPKLIHLSSFVELVKDYGVLPTMISGAVAVLIPFGELTGATLLLFPETLQAGSLILLVLLLSFLYAVSQVIRRNKILTCGCYGKNHNHDVIPGPPAHLRKSGAIPVSHRIDRGWDFDGGLHAIVAKGLDCSSRYCAKAEKCKLVGKSASLPLYSCSIDSSGYNFLFTHYFQCILLNIFEID